MNFHLAPDKLLRCALTEAKFFDHLRLCGHQSDCLGCEELGGQVAAQLVVVEDAEDEGDGGD